VPERSRAWVALALVGLIAATAALMSLARADACALDPRRPHTYEGDQVRQAYLSAIDAASVNALFPGDPYFGLPGAETGARAARTDGPAVIPSVLLKAIAWVESDMTMASRSVSFNSIGDALISFDCGHGIMQVTTGMTLPLGEGGRATDRQVLVATHYVYNVARGAYILVDKWNQAPEFRPIAGTDTGSNPLLVENWYYAVWSYNGFTGPGSTRSNHPADATFTWPRPAYRCDGTQSRGRYPYQELVWGCMANPPARNGQQLWQPVVATLPDLTRPEFSTPLNVNRFQYPYVEMDMPTPAPAHLATPANLPAGYRERALASPALSITGSASITLQTNGSPAQQTARVSIHNAGTGVLTWYATTSDNFLILTPPAGAAVGGDVPCATSGCPNGTLTISVNPTLLPRARATGQITIASPNSSAAPVVISVQVVADFEVGTPGTSRAR